MYKWIVASREKLLDKMPHWLSTGALRGESPNSLKSLICVGQFFCLAVAQQRKRHIKRVWEAREAARKFQSCVLPRFISLYEADILAVRGTGWWQTRFLLNYCQNLSLAVIESDANCCARSAKSDSADVRMDTPDWTEWPMLFSCARLTPWRALLRFSSQDGMIFYDPLLSLCDWHVQTSPFNTLICTHFLVPCKTTKYI